MSNYIPKEKYRVEGKYRLDTSSKIKENEITMFQGKMHRLTEWWGEYANDRNDGTVLKDVRYVYYIYEEV